MDKTYYIYIIRSEKNTLYTGITTDIFRRLEEHFYQGKKAARYTKSFKIEDIEMILIANNRAIASKVEYYLKSFSKDKKEEFLKNPLLIVEDLYNVKQIKVLIYHPLDQIKEFLKKLK
jgi:putative endonuclease